MRANDLWATSSTGGQGDLVLSSITGPPGFIHAFPNGSGIRQMAYQMREYSSSTHSNANLLREESGVAPFDPSTGTLARSTGRVNSCWDGAAYYPNDNAPLTTTTGSLTSGATSMSVTSAAGFPASGTFPVLLSGVTGEAPEVVNVTAGAGTTTWTITRAYRATAAAAHSSGANVSLLPYPQNFGSTSANIEITNGLDSGSFDPAFDFITGPNGGSTDAIGVTQLNINTTSSVTSCITSSGFGIYYPARFVFKGPITRCAIRLTTGMTLAGGTRATYQVALYEPSANGLAGRRLALFNGFGGTAALTTASGTTLFSTPLAVPIQPPNGWYFLHGLYVAGTDAGTANIAGSLGIEPSGLGVRFGSSPPVLNAYFDSAGGLTTPPATGPTAPAGQNGATGNPMPIVVFS